MLKQIIQLTPGTSYHPSFHDAVHTHNRKRAYMGSAKKWFKVLSAGIADFYTLAPTPTILTIRPYVLIGSPHLSQK